jgi:Protein of unknown function (DUF4239)
MNWRAIAGPLWRRVAWLTAAVWCYWFWRGTSFSAFTAGETEGLNTLILLLGSIYAVMYAFVVFVIWSQFTEVEKFVMRECDSLDDLLRFSHYGNADASRALRRAVAEYVQAVVQSEWPALSQRETDQAAENGFTTLLTVVLRTAPASPAEEAIQQRLIDIVREAGEHRDERITQSLTRIPPTLLGFVHVLAAALLALVFVYPFHHALAGAACFALTAAVLLLANLVTAELDNPFQGAYNVSPAPFARLTR